MFPSRLGLALRHTLPCLLATAALLPLLTWDQARAPAPAALHAAHSLLQPVAIVAPLRPQGAFVVEAWQSGRWQALGEIPADKHLRLGTLRLPPALDAGPLRLRLTAQGGGGAHLDSVHLNGEPPRSVQGAQRHKLLARDYDLADARGRSIELEFPHGADAGGSNFGGTLQVTGRIEPEVLPERPFQFPLVDIRRPITPQSAFYSYRLGSRPGQLAVDGDLNAEALGRPFFQGFYPVGSGHPQVPTLGWVFDDGEQLYVAFDVIGDNTLDGGADYTKVYVNTPTGVRMFQVTAEQSTWGRAGFQYTPLVPWEHKVYEFAIPLAALGLDALRAAGTSLQLAFAAYGTFSVSEGAWYPSIGFGSDQCVFLTAYPRAPTVATHFNEMVRVYDPAGALAVAETTLSGDLTQGVTSEQLRPAVAYDPGLKRFLVVWPDNSGLADVEIFAEFISEAGTASGTGSNISNAAGDQIDVDVAFEPTSGTYLVVWEDDNTPDQLKGIYLGADGTATGNAITGPTNAAVGVEPAVEADPINQRFLVVWRDDSGTSSDIWGQVYDATGGTVGSALTISTNTTQQETVPELAFDPVNSRYLVVWKESSGGGDLFARLINADGTAFGGVITIIDEPEFGQSGPAVAFDPINETYLVVWEDDDTGDIESAYVSATGTATAGPSFGVGGQVERNPTVAANIIEGGFLVAYQTEQTTNPDIAVGSAIVAATLGGGSGIHMPPWAGAWVLSMAALWLACWFGARARSRLRPVLQAVTVALALSVAVATVAACTSDDPSDPGTTLTCPTA